MTDTPREPLGDAVEKAVKYAVALIEGRIPLEGPTNRPILQRYVSTLRALLTREPLGDASLAIECPCCGGEGAVDVVYDGQKLICGCPGWVTIEEDGEAWINNGDEPCEQCKERP